MFDPDQLRRKSDELFVIAGPCVIESRELCMTIAERLRAICDGLGISLIFKGSFDKANRSSGSSFRGPGLEAGLRILDEVRRAFGVAILSDVHEVAQVRAAGEVLDVLQVPAFLARQTDLLQACGATGKWVNVKKGQFMSPAEMGSALAKVRSGRNEAKSVADPGSASRVMLCERGTFFGYGRLVNDFTGLSAMKAFDVPVVFDITHSTQQPAALGDRSGGSPEHSPMLARAAVAAGVDGLFLECHPEPAKALSDASTMLKLDEVEGILRSCVEIARLRTGW